MDATGIGPRPKAATTLRAGRRTGVVTTKVETISALTRLVVRCSLKPQRQGDSKEDGNGRLHGLFPFIKAPNPWTSSCRLRDMARNNRVGELQTWCRQCGRI